MPKFNVYTGRASWHQRRAGHTTAGITSFSSKDAAEKYAATYRKNHPDEPCYIVEVK